MAPNQTPPRGVPSERVAIPGLAEAIARQRLVRDSAFLAMPDGTPLRESIAGYEVMPMNVFHYNLLTLAASPLLVGLTPTPLQLCQFLWVLSPQFTTGETKAKRRLFRRFKNDFMPLPPPLIPFKWIVRRWRKKYMARLTRAAEVMTACSQFVHETFMDRPARKVKGVSEPDYYSDTCWFTGTLAREYGWTQEAIYKVPLKRVFQFINEARKFHDPKAVLFNPSDAVNEAFIKERNARAKGVSKA